MAKKDNGKKNNFLSGYVAPSVEKKKVESKPKQSASSNAQNQQRTTNRTQTRASDPVTSRIQNDSQKVAQRKVQTGPNNPNKQKAQQQMRDQKSGIAGPKDAIQTRVGKLTEGAVNQQLGGLATTWGRDTNDANEFKKYLDQGVTDGKWSQEDADKNWNSYINSNKKAKKDLDWKDSKGHEMFQALEAKGQEKNAKGDKQIEEGKKGLGKGGQLAADAYTSALGMLGDMATGPAWALSMASRTYGNTINSTRELVDKGIITEREAEMNALGQAAKETGTEYVFKGAGLAKGLKGVGEATKGFEKALGGAIDKLTSKIDNKMLREIAHSAMKNAGGIAEEATEELLGGIIEPGVTNLAYANKVDKRNQNAYRENLIMGSTDLQRQVDYLTAQGYDRNAIINGYAGQIANDDYKAEIAAMYMENGFSEKQANKIASGMQEYMLASLSGDEKAIKAAEDKMVDRLGKYTSMRQHFSASDTLDAMASAALMVGVTGGAGSIQSSVIGADFRKAFEQKVGKANATSALLNTAMDLDDADVAARAQAMKDNGGQLANQQWYDLGQAIEKQTDSDRRSEMSARIVSAGQVKKSRYFAAPDMAIDAEGNIARDENGNIQYSNEVANYRASLVRGSVTQAAEQNPELVKDMDEDEQRKVAESIEKIALGFADVSSVNNLTLTHPEARALFEQVTGETLPSTNKATREFLFNKSIENYVDTSRAATIDSVDVRKGSLDVQYSNSFGGEGQSVFSELSSNVDMEMPENFVQFASVAGTVYDFGRQGASMEDVLAYAESQDMSREDAQKLYDAGVADAEDSGFTVTYDVSEASIDKIKNSDRQFFLELAKIFGVNIVISDDLQTQDERQANGSYEEKTNTLYLNLNDAITKNIGYTITHELTHRIKLYNRDAYEVFAKSFKERAIEKNGQEWFDEAINERIERYTGADELDEDGALEEIIADQMGEILHDREFIENFVSENTEEAQTILSAIRDIIRKITQLFAVHGGFRSDYNEALLSELGLLREAEMFFATSIQEARSQQTQEMLEREKYLQMIEGVDFAKLNLSPDGWLSDEDAAIKLLAGIKYNKAEFDEGSYVLGVIPEIYTELFNIGALDVVIRPEHTYENLNTKKQAEADGKYKKKSGKHYHNIPISEYVDDIESISDPVEIYDGWNVGGKKGRPRINLKLKSGKLATLEFYSGKDVIGSNNRKNHAVITLFDKNDPDGYFDGIADKMLYKKNSDTTEATRDQSPSSVKVSELEDRLSQFNEKLNTYKKNRGINYSIDASTMSLDAEYEQAVESGDEKAMAKLVKQAAKIAGFTKKTYHGTRSFGFTVIDTQYSDDGISFFSSDDLSIASSYSSSDGKRRVGKKREAVAYDRTRFDELGNSIFDSNEELANRLNGLAGTDLFTVNDFIWLLDHKSSNTVSPDFVTYYDALVDKWEDAYLESHGVDEYGDGEFTDYYLDESGNISKEAMPIDELIQKIANDYVEYKQEEKLVADFDHKNGESQNGNYEFYVNPTGFFVIDGKGSNWNRIEHEGRLKTTRQIAKWAKDNGYKGVWFKNIVDTANSSISRKSSNVYIAFDPQAQVKSADPVTYDDTGRIIPLSERFNSENNDIRYSLDSEGRELTPGQQEFFKESKIRDENGNLRVMYHGSRNVFEQFDIDQPALNGRINGKGFYFTYREDDAESWANRDWILEEDREDMDEDYEVTMYKVYLNIVNPYILEDINFDPDTIADELIAQGYDGIIVPAYDEVIAFYPEQIKSTDNENPTEDKRMKYSIDAAEVESELYKPADEDATSAPMVKFSFGDRGTMLGGQVHSNSGSNPTGNAKINKKTREALLKSGKERLAEVMGSNIRARLKKEGIKGKEATAIVNEEVKRVTDFLEYMNDMFVEMATGDIYTFVGLDQVMNAQVKVRRGKDGNIMSVAMSAMIKNGEYPVNFDFTTICKKRQAFNAIIEKLSKESGKDVAMSLTPAQLMDINQALRKEGVETACLGCFVEARRYHMQNYTTKVVELWNGLVDEEAARQGIPLDSIEDFGFSDETELTEKEYQAAADTFLDYENTKVEKDSPKKRFRQIIKSSNNEYLKHITAADLVTAKGIEKITGMSAGKYSLLGMFKSAYGVSAPKETIAYTPYNSEIANLPKTKDKKPYTEYLKKIGGVRMQSFSDFLIANTFDYMQMVADMAARGFPAHAYTKEIAFAKIFGQTGIKINMSIMFDVENAKTWGEAFGIEDAEEQMRIAKKYAGLQFFKNREDAPDYLREHCREVTENGVTGYVTFLVSDKRRSDEHWQKTFEQEFARNGGDEVAARQLANERRKWTQSIDFKDAKELQKQDGYSKNVGIIGVGLSDQNILMMLEDEAFPYIIPYHASGLPEVIKVLTNLNYATNYEDTQNTRIFVGITDAEGKTYTQEELAKRKEELGSWSAVYKELNVEGTVYEGRTEDKENGEKNKDGDKYNLAGTGGFDFYKQLEKGKKPQEISEMYLEYCAEYGLLPVFPQFAGHENYYKLLIDYNVTDIANNNAPSPQVAVTNNYPGVDVDAGESDYSKVESLIKEEAAIINEQNRKRDEVVENYVKNAKLSLDADVEQIKQKKRKSKADVETLRDAGEKLSEDDFYKIYYVHVLDIASNGGNINDTISDIKENGFRGKGVNVIPASEYRGVTHTSESELKQRGYSDEEIQSFKDHKARIRSGYVWGDNAIHNNVSLPLKAYGYKAGQAAMLIPSNYVSGESIVNGFKPFDYEVVVPETQYQSPYELYSKAFDNAQTTTPDSVVELTPVVAEDAVIKYSVSKSSDFTSFIEDCLEGDTSDEAQARRQKSRDEIEAALAHIVRKDTQLTYGKTLNRKSVKKPIKELVFGLMESSENTYADKMDAYNYAMDMADAIWHKFYNKEADLSDLLLITSRELVEDIKFVDDDMYNAYNDLRRYMRNHRISVPEFIKEDISWADYRKKNFGRMLLTSESGFELDKMWHEISPMLVPFVDATEYTADGSDNLRNVEDMSSMFLAISDALDNTKAYRDAYADAFAQDIELQFAKDLAAITIKQGEAWESFADKKKEYYETRTKEMQARHKVAMRELREQRDRKLAEAEQKRKDDLAKQKQKYEERDEKRKIAEAEKKEKQKAKKQDHKARMKAFGHIEKNYNWLTKRLLDPKKEDDQHIPEGFISSLARVLAEFDMQSQRSLDRERLMDMYYHDGKNHPSKPTEALRKMREELQELSKEDESGIFVYNGALFSIMDNLIKSLNGHPLRDLNTEDLTNIDDMLASIKHMIQNENTLFADAKKQAISSAGDAVIKESKEKAARYGRRYDRKGPFGTLNHLLNEDMMTPMNFFKSLGPQMRNLYKHLRYGQDDYIRKIDELRHIFDDMFKPYRKKGFLGHARSGSSIEDWQSDKSVQTFKVASGEEVKMSVAQIMSLYCLSKREQAMQHILGNGVVLSDVKMTKLMDKITGKVERTASSVRLTYDDVIKITESLTQEQKELAQKMQELMNGKLQEWGNETSMQLYGIRLFKEKNYFPIESSNSYIPGEIGKASGIKGNKITSFGFTKPLTEGANNPIVIGDIFDIVTDHSNKMALYSAYAAPLIDINRVMNHVRRNEETGLIEGSVKQVLQDAYGPRAIKFIDNLLDDINGQANTRMDGMQEIINKSLGNYKSAAIGFNLRVLVQQPTAILRATYYINPIYFANPSEINLKKNVREMHEHCPIAAWKAWGNYQNDFSRGLQDIITNNSNSMWETLTMGIYGFADDMTWGMIWGAVKNEVKAKHPNVKYGSEEFWTLCNERASLVFDETQVVDSVFHRSDTMRSKDTMTKLVSSFMAEPTRTYNMMRSSLVMSYRMVKDGDKIGATKEMTKAITVFVANAAAVSAAAAAVDALRGKGGDDDDDWYELWIDNFINNLKDNGNLLNNIVWIKDISGMIVNAMNGEYLFGTSNMALEGWYKLAKGIEQIPDVMSGDMSIFELITGDLGAGLGYITGVPTFNMVREVKTLWTKLGLPVFATDGEEVPDTIDASETKETFFTRFGIGSASDNYQKHIDKLAKKYDGKSDDSMVEMATDGYRKLVDSGDFSELSARREAVRRAGGDVDAFDDKIHSYVNTTFKKTIGSSTSQSEFENQQAMKDWMLSNGWTEQQISDVAYRSDTAREFKAACRMLDHDAAVKALTPLLEAGLTEQDIYKLWNNRNRGNYDTSSTGTYVWGTEGTITSGFGNRGYVTAGASSYHQGIDIGAEMGTNVVAADGGVVTFAGNDGSGYGNYIIVTHDNGSQTYYGHLSGIGVKKGQRVSQSQPIGNVGSTGVSTGPHLHFALKINGTFVDPSKYIKQ